MSVEDPVHIRVSADVARLLRDTRRARGLTQRELAALVGMHHAPISDYETGAKTPSVKSLLKLADALGFDLWAFRKVEIEPGTDHP